MRKVLVLEDESSIRSFIVINLRRAGYDVIEAGSGEEALECLKENPDTKVALLDIMLPEEDGISVLKKLRKDGRTARLPIIMLTAKGTEYDKVLGLDAGADDYIAKPFGMMELLSRIRALARRTSEKPSTYQCGCLCVDEGRHTVTVEGHETVLTQKEFELLCLLLQNRGQVFSRERLIEQVWGYAFTGETRTVDVHIRTLRQKLGPAGAYIQTVRGYGYKIDGEG